jgi:hypothetical protein
MAASRKACIAPAYSAAASGLLVFGGGWSVIAVGRGARTAGPGADAVSERRVSLHAAAIARRANATRMATL